MDMDKWDATQRQRHNEWEATQKYAEAQHREHLKRMDRWIILVVVAITMIAVFQAAIVVISIW